MQTVWKSAILATAALALSLGTPAIAQDDDGAEASALLRAIGMLPMEGEELSAVMAKAAKHPLGSEQNPVRAKAPEGQRAYLKRLRCPNGKAPAFNRLGNIGPGIYGSIVDLYEIKCKGGLTAEVVIDMYHPDYVEMRPIPGFTIEAP